jgi:hypothetical protein
MCIIHDNRSADTIIDPPPSHVSPAQVGWGNVSKSVDRAHLGLDRNPRYRQIIEEERRLPAAHVAGIWAEQEAKNAALHEIDCSHIPLLRVADRYALGRLGIRPCGQLDGKLCPLRTDQKGVAARLWRR